MNLKYIIILSEIFLGLFRIFKVMLSSVKVFLIFPYIVLKFSWMRRWCRIHVYVWSELKVFHRREKLFMFRLQGSEGTIFEYVRWMGGKTTKNGTHAATAVRHHGAGMWLNRSKKMYFIFFSWRGSPWVGCWREAVGLLSAPVVRMGC